MMVSLKLSKLILKLDFHTRPKWRSGVEFQIDENIILKLRVEWPLDLAESNFEKHFPVFTTGKYHNCRTVCNFYQ